MKNLANILTLARIVLMPIPGWLLYQGASQLFVCLALIVVLGLTDWLDGVIARRAGPTVLGGLLDPIADKIFVAVIFLPLTERYAADWDRTIIPMWMTCCIFLRDFLVTSLRTSLLLRDAPMRTSQLAKFKTAAQMLGVGYIIFFYAATLAAAAEWITWIALAVPIAVPLSLVVYRLIRGRKQGRRSLTMLGLMTAEAALRILLGADWASLLTLAGITAITVVSGLSYLADAWDALKGKPRGFREVGRFALDGVLVPIGFLTLLGRVEAFGASAMIIVAVTLELAAGGLANLVASHRIAPRFRWIALKSTLQIALCGAALAIDLFGLRAPAQADLALVAAATAVTLIFAVISFVRHRRLYLAAL
jgi:CDP-diacylglycerol--glycerol-3-phosphate 3-phosphatidyltransferase/cardiolipin synthase